MLEVFGLHTLESFNVKVVYLTILFGEECLCLSFEHDGDSFVTTNVGWGSDMGIEGDCFRTHWYTYRLLVGNWFWRGLFWDPFVDRRLFKVVNWS